MSNMADGFTAVMHAHARGFEPDPVAAAPQAKIVAHQVADDGAELPEERADPSA